jgi:hypothetical protein
MWILESFLVIYPRPSPSACCAYGRHVETLCTRLWRVVGNYRHIGPESVTTKLRHWQRISIVTLSITSIMTTSLDYLKQTGTVVVSDSGDFEC